MFVYFLKIKTSFLVFIWWAGKDSNLRTQMRTDFLLLQFSLPNQICLQSGLSLYLISKIPGIKSLHSEFLPSSGLSSAYTVKTSPNQPSYHLVITDKSCKFRFLFKTKDHSLPPLATRPPTHIKFQNLCLSTLAIISFLCFFVNTFSKIFSLLFRFKFNNIF